MVRALSLEGAEDRRRLEAKVVGWWKTEPASSGF